MLMSIYKKAFAVLAKKPIKLWGISLLSGILSSVISFLFGLTIGISLALNLLISVSMIMVYLHGYKGEDVKVVHLFDCFKDWATIKRVVCGMGWMYLWMFIYAIVPVILGGVAFALLMALFALIPIVGTVLGILCIVAGSVASAVFVIIKSYAWRFTPYILVNEQDVSITEAIKVSETRTKGFKFKMFLSEFLVSLICSVSLGILGALCAVPAVGFIFAIIFIVAALAVVMFQPLYLGLVQAAFYVEIENINKTGFNPYAQPTFAPQNPYGQNPYGGQNPYAQAPQNPYAQPQNPYAQRPQGAPQQNPYAGQNPYAQAPQNPYAQAPQNPYAQPQQNPYAQPQQNPNNNQ